VSDGLRFTGSNQLVATQSRPLPTEYQTALTVAAWVRPNAKDGTIIGRYITSTNQREFFWAISNWGLRGMVSTPAGGSGNFQHRQADVALTSNAWSHVAFTWSSGQTMRFYVNGRAVTSSPQLGSTDAFAAMTYNAGVPTTVAFLPASAFGYLVGTVRSVGLYSRNLSPAEVAALYKEGLR
jgi:hypothetical protein